MTQPTSKTERMKIGTLTRAAEVGAANEEDRTVEISFSSETEVNRYFGVEVLDHDPKSVRLDRLLSDGAVLVNHDMDDHVGTVETAEIGADRKGRAVVRFGKSARAEEVFRDVLDGIRKSISVGYRVYKMVLEEQSEDSPEKYRVMDWEPHELSFVSVPADTAVGVGRNTDENGHEVEIVKPVSTRTMEQKTMDKQPVDNAAPATPAPAAQAVTATDNGATERALKAQRKELDRIIELGKRFNQNDAAQAALRDGKSADDFLEYCLDQNPGTEVIRTGAPEIGLTKKEAENFSFVRAGLALMDGNWKGAEFEREVHEATCDKFKGRKFEGLAIPVDVMTAKHDHSVRRIANGQLDMQRFAGMRGMQVGVNDQGGYLVGTDHLGGSFIELLRAQMLLTSLGARFLSGLVGDVAIPKQTGAATTYWVNEDEDTTESSPTVGQVTLRPKTIGAYVPVTRRMLLQSSPDVEAMLREDFAMQLALGIEAAAYNGAGAGGEPLGIINTTGVGSVDYGAGMTFGDAVDAETEVATDNALMGSLGYVFTHGLAGDMKQTLRDSAVAGYIWEKDEVNGYPAYRTSQMPTAKGIFGNWSDLVIGEWGVLDLKMETGNKVRSGGAELVALQDIDIAVRNAQSFAYLYT